MRHTAHAADRLAARSDAHTPLRNPVARYRMSVAEAECITHELHRRRQGGGSTHLLDGQIWYTAVATDEPAGKPTARCHT